ncbi:hypothetical protein CDAR_22041 [Caerostris darwini]|uniref:Uncharacterized protein n=1 Tax=Caerostris darwini TaxID=1538125 RepID=A0AAV4W503_9ARAC|nr:hypothetical protein CDAR_22041 [Caerostris darwini]
MGLLSQHCSLVPQASGPGRLCFKSYPTEIGTEKPAMDSFHKMPLSLLKRQLLTENLNTWQQSWSSSLKGRDISALSKDQPQTDPQQLLH